MNYILIWETQSKSKKTENRMEGQWQGKAMLQSSSSPCRGENRTCVLGQKEMILSLPESSELQYDPAHVCSYKKTVSHVSSSEYLFLAAREAGKYYLHVCLKISSLGGNKMGKGD